MLVKHALSTPECTGKDGIWESYNHYFDGPMLSFGQLRFVQ